MTRYAQLAAAILAVVATRAVRADVVTYQQGAPDPFTATNYTGEQDLWLYTNGTGGYDENTGADGRMIVGGTSAATPRHELMRWNLSSLAGRYTTITAVTLRLHWATATSGNTGTVQMYPLAAANAGWVEGVHGTGVTAGANESCWEYKNYSTTNWAGSQGASTSGTDFLSTLLSSKAYVGTEAVGDTFDLPFGDPTAIIGWTTAAPNAGLFFRTAAETNQAIFDSNNAGSMQPQLIITYTPVPEPSTLVLTGAALAAGVTARRRRR